MSLMYLFSAVEGTVVLDGKPVSGASVTRRYLWHWKDKKESARVTTGANGTFSFAEVTGSSFLGGWLPHQPLVEQEILIAHEGKEYKAWVHAKGDYEPNSENEGRPLRMYCELRTPEKVTYINEPMAKKYFGLCELR